MFEIRTYSSWNNWLRVLNLLGMPLVMYNKGIPLKRVVYISTRAAFMHLNRYIILYLYVFNSNRLQLTLQNNITNKFINFNIFLVIA